MAQHFTQVDAFTDRPFAGNPAAVCLLPSPRDAHWMQRIASEMNLAETAFLVPRADGFDLRWFTPGAEVDLCGHATLASAHALWEEGHLSYSEDARFHTRSGLLTATRRGDHIWLDFPSTPVSSAAPPQGLEQAIGRKATMVGRNVVELDSEAAVRSLAPDMTLIAGIPCRGVIVTAPSSDIRYDFVSRFFAPGLGIPEDPVTGSAHCGLAPYWGTRLGKDEMVGYQASPRGGTVLIRVEGNRVHLGGQAVTVVRGEILH
jgi:predicted PhzF superfamily epimerase YddE/YHI9